MDALSASIVVLLVLAQVRNILAQLWVHRAIKEAFELNCADIDAGIYEHGQWRYDLIPSHVALMFDLTQWRYRSPFEA
ncbi:hypothetical protein [Roseateles sp. PN1]|uniref:hypothetical protein n=1 Tax=Roseateles sp. PN1 TaxID=3137372 RepID=UPI0031388E6D